MIVNALPLKPYASLLMLAILIFAGFAIQAALMIKNSPRS